MSKNEIIGLFVAGIIFAGVLAVVLLLKLINTAQAIQIIISFVLVLITAIYVKRTSDIARATKEQADASVKMAERMREQRYNECLPILVLSIIPTWNTEGFAPNEIPYVYLQNGIGVKVMWCNVSKGVAINLRFSFYTAPTSPGKASFFPPRESGTLEVGGKREIDYSEMLNDSQLREVTKEYCPHLLAEYQDIYERKVTTVQEFRIDKQNERAFLGDLYLTVNGRRLGQEVTQHD